MNVGPTIVASSQAPELVKPRHGALDGPANSSQAAGMRRSGLGQHGNDAALTQGVDPSLRVIGPIGLGAIRTLTGSSSRAGQRRNRIDQRNQLLAIRAIGRSEGVGQRDALGIGREVVFASRFASIRRIGAGFVAPPTARTEALSIKARDQSIGSASCSMSNKTRCRPAQTPAFCRSRSRRQQAMPPPQPIRGASPPNGCRSALHDSIPAGGPPLGYVRGRGNPGSMTDQSSSVSNGLAMNPSSVTFVLMTPSFIHRRICRIETKLC